MKPINTDKVSKLSRVMRRLNRNDQVKEIEKIAGLFPRGFYSIVASMAGTGKTWLMQYICCQLSLGGEILNGLSTEPPRKCLIFSGETGSDLLTLRLKKSAWKNDPTNVIIYSALEMATLGLNCWINTTDGQDTIANVLAIERPDIVFFDTLISFHTADESKQGEMTSLYTWLARVAKFYNCAIVCNHHTRKRPPQNTTKKFTQEDVIGSSAGVRLAANVFIITSQDKNNGGFINTVDNPKSWDKKTPPFTYEFIRTEKGIDFKVDINLKPEMSVPIRFFSWIKSLAPGSLFSLQDVQNACKITRYMAEEEIAKLFEYGSIDKVPMTIKGVKTMYWQLTRQLPSDWA